MFDWRFFWSSTVLDFEPTLKYRPKSVTILVRSSVVKAQFINRNEFIKVHLKLYFYVCYSHVFSNCLFEYTHNHSGHIYKAFLQYEFVCALANHLTCEIVCHSIHKHVVLYYCDDVHADLVVLSKVVHAGSC